MIMGRNHRIFSRSQQGLGLLELLVAMVIGLIVVGGSIQLFSSSKRSYRVQEATARIQENARFAMVFMGQQIRMAGFRGLDTDPSISLAAAFQADVTNGFSAGQVVLGADVATAVESIHDEITIRYQGAGTWYADPVLNCLGVPLASGAPPVVSRFFVSANNELSCRVVGGAAQPLISNVQDMEIWYGIDTDIDAETTSANAYVSAATIAAEIAGAGRFSWNSVRSVRIALLLQSEEDNLATEPQPYYFNQGTGHTFAGSAIVPVDDVSTAGRNESTVLRRVVTATFNLRNLSP